MDEPDFILEIFLQPGEYYWGDAETRIKTLLGSCVALCVWHPRLKIGGMSHSLLPSGNSNPVPAELSARYVDQSVAMFLASMAEAGTKPEEYEVKLFGGGDMFGHLSGSRSVGEKNIEKALELISKYNLKKKSQHIGGAGHRNIIMDMWSGDVWMRHIPIGGQHA